MIVGGRPFSRVLLSPAFSGVVLFVPARLNGEARSVDKLYSPAHETMKLYDPRLSATSVVDEDSVQIDLRWRGLYYETFSFTDEFTVYREHSFATTLVPDEPRSLSGEIRLFGQPKEALFVIDDVLRDTIVGGRKAKLLVDCTTRYERGVAVSAISIGFLVAQSFVDESSFLADSVSVGTTDWYPVYEHIGVYRVDANGPVKYDNVNWSLVEDLTPVYEAARNAVQLQDGDKQDLPLSVLLRDGEIVTYMA